MAGIDITELIANAPCIRSNGPFESDCELDGLDDNGQPQFKHTVCLVAHLNANRSAVFDWACGTEAPSTPLDWED